MSRRQTRLNEQIKREIAEIVRWEVADPRVGPAAVTGAEVAPDLTSARVFVALIGDEEERRQSLEGLEAAAPYIRSQLAQRLDLRRTPELRFFPDETMDRAARIEELLAEVEPEEGWKEEAREGDAAGEGGAAGEGDAAGEADAAGEGGVTDEKNRPMPAPRDPLGG